jgi:hypothetical protein
LASQVTPMSCGDFLLLFSFTAAGRFSKACSRSCSRRTPG